VKANNPNATIIGETTFGTGTVLSNFGLGDGSALLLGTELWLTPEGELIKNQGIRPDVVVGLAEGQTPFVPVNGVTPEDASSNDHQLEWAIGILENGKAGADRPSLYSPPVRGN
jgi:carboxyl-terminal processing protease